MTLSQGGAGLQPGSHNSTLEAAEALRYLEAMGKDPAAAWFRTLPARRERHGFDDRWINQQIKAKNNVYLVTGDAVQATGPGGMVQDSDVTACRALFVEWDEEGTPIEEQAQRWQAMGLPEPTITVSSGGKSAHLYWVLDQPMAPAQWKPIQVALIDHCNGDKACKNPSRLMRLPGSVYFDKKTGEATGRCRIIASTGTRYTAAEIEACIPKPAPRTKPKPVRGGVVTLEQLLPRDLELLARNGSPEGSRNGNAFKLAASAIALADAAAAAGLAVDGTPEDLVLAFAARCSPELEESEARRCLESAASQPRQPDRGWPDRLSYHLRATERIPQRSEPKPLGEGSAAMAAGAKAVRLSPAQVLEMLPGRVGMPRLNTRSQAITAGDQVMSGNTAARLYLELSNAGETWPKDSTYDAVLLLAERNAFDPVADYLNSNTVAPLPMDQWRRLDRCLLGIDDPIAARFLPRYLIAAVARTFEPGCDFRQSPVLVGPQWIGKTALGRILFGAEHFISGIGKQDTAAQARCHHAWGVELAELDGITRRSDQEGLKAFLSETSDVFRRPYDKVDERHPRRFLFWGTSNGAALSDTTGNTRFVCIPIRQAMPLDWAVQNRDAIWSRAVEQYRAGADWQQCDQGERDAIAERNDNYQQEDPWLLPVQQYLNHCEAEQRLPVQVRDLLVRLGIPEERRGTREAKRVRSLAESLGWAVERRSIAGVRTMGLWPAATPLPQPATPLPQPATPPNTSQGDGSSPAATAATPKQKELKKKEVEAPAAAAPAETPPAHAKCSRFGVAAVADGPEASQAGGSSGVAVVWQWCGSDASGVAATPTITGLELPPPPVGSGADVDGPDDWPGRQRVA